MEGLLEAASPRSKEQGRSGSMDRVLRFKLVQVVLKKKTYYLGQVVVAVTLFLWSSFRLSSYCKDYIKPSFVQVFSI